MNCANALAQDLSLAINVTQWATGSLEPSDVLIVLIFCQNDSFDCRNLTTILYFFFARIHQNQHLRVARAWHFHCNARASFFVEDICPRFLFLWSAQFCFSFPVIPWNILSKLQAR